MRIRIHRNGSYGPGHRSRCRRVRRRSRDPVFSNRTAAKACVADEAQRDRHVLERLLARQADILIRQTQGPARDASGDLPIGRSTRRLRRLLAADVPSTRSPPRLRRELHRLRVMPRTSRPPSGGMTAGIRAHHRRTGRSLPIPHGSVGRTILIDEDYFPCSRPWPRALRPGISELLILSLALVSARPVQGQRRRDRRTGDGRSTALLLAER